MFILISVANPPNSMSWGSGRKATYMGKKPKNHLLSDIYEMFWSGLKPSTALSLDFLLTIHSGNSAVLLLLDLSTEFDTIH